ncbi:MAG: UDP-glucose 4-epimerase GalE [Thermonemataceae bacterium]|nr:UDP-glucose 4-epimerase GalE [Thermonemataceae bacterium]
MQILVTGGLGFIGSHTVIALLEADFEPIIIDNLSNSERFILNRIEQIAKRKIKFYEADCLDYSSFEQIFTENSIEGVIHFAAYKAVGESVAEPLKYYENNLLSLLYLLRLMEKYQVKQLVFSSSCTVYGQAEQLPVSEEAPILPALSPYGNTKQIGEEIIRDVVRASQNLQAISLRYFNPIGSHSSGLIGELPKGVPNNLVPFITQTAIGIRKELQVFGNDYPTKDGTCIRDYIHVMDLAEAHVKALQYLQTQNNKLFDFVNIGTGDGASVMEVIRTFENVAGETLNYHIAPRRKGDVTAVYADARKAQKLFAWQAKRTLAQALFDAWNWQKNLQNF